MLKSYLKVALRTLRKQKVVSVVTIGSLAVGLACCLLLFLYVRHEWTYDQFHAEADRIFRVVNEGEEPSGAQTLSAKLRTSAGPALIASLPAVEAGVRFVERDVTITTPDGQTFEDVSITLADSSVFDVFSGFRLRQGSEQAALARPGNVVISKEAAHTYFGDENPVGRRLTVEFNEETLEATVAGVAAKPAGPSSIPFDVVMPFGNIEKEFSAQTWKIVGDQLPLANTYVRLSEKTDAGEVAARASDLIKERAGGDIEVLGRHQTTGYRLQPLADVHLAADVEGGLKTPGNPVYSYTLAGIALLILALACINFTTLSLVRSSGRSREVGIRKTFGARREQVAGQFWGEALLTTAFALVAGVALARLGLPVFNRLMQQELHLNLLGSPSVWLALGAMVVLVGLVAGGYPALALSGFAPTEVLRGSRGRVGGRSRFARVLVAVQFGLAIALVAGVLIMQGQMAYMTEESLTFDADQIVRVSVIDAMKAEENSEDASSIYDRFRQEASRQSSVKAVAGSATSFPGGGGFSNTLQLGDTASVRAYYNGVSENFTEIMNVRLLAGRGLGEGAAAGGRQPALVNRALVKALGWPSPEAALGKEVPLETVLGGDAVEIVGVIENFHYQPLRQQIKPLVLAPLEDMPSIMGSTLYARFPPGQTSEALASLEETWQRVAPAGVPFEYEFLDDVVREQYEAEQRWQALVRYAAGLALLISCAGLFGLALLSVKRREKEIGIRKVMGASAWNVVALVSRQFAWLVAAGFALAVPLAWWGARRWLQTFAYRIELGMGPFLAAGAVVLAVAMATVGYQALRAARANPVDALRQE